MTSYVSSERTYSVGGNFVSKFPVRKSDVEGFLERRRERFPVSQSLLAEMVGSKRTVGQMQLGEMEEVVHESVNLLVFKIAKKYSYGFRDYEIVDLAQECWGRIFSKLSRYNSEKGAFTTWCWRVSSNVLNKKWRWAKKRDEITVDFPDGFDENRCGGPVKNRDMNLHDEIIQAVRDLKEKHPEYAHIIDGVFRVGDGGLPMKINEREVSRISGVTPTTVSRVMKRVIRPFFIQRFK